MTEIKITLPNMILLPSTDYNDIKDNLSSIVRYSNIIAQPEFNLGFHSYIHQTKNKMDITSKLSTKEKFYYVVNPFESNDILLKEVSSKLNIKEDKPEILSRAFFKMWEMLLVFDIGNEKDLGYSALAEGPGSFLQAVLHYREKYYNIKSDSFSSITIHPEDGKNIDVSKNFLGYYDERYPKLINPHKTYKVKYANKYKGKDNGDLTDYKSISNFRKEIKKGKKLSKLVTADGGFAWNDENYQEQESYPLVLGQILSAIMVQDKDGNFVIKFFETFTGLSIKIVYLLSSLYEKCYFYKPYFSRLSNSERYMVCKGFKYDQKKDKKLLDVLYSDLEKILKQFNSEQYIVDIFPKMIVSKDFINKVRLFNIQISNKQQEMINLIVSYIKENNYFGDKYHQYLDSHNESIKFWINNFLPEKENLENRKEKWATHVNNVLKHNDEELDMLNYID